MSSTLRIGTASAWPHPDLRKKGVAAREHNLVDVRLLCSTKCRSVDILCILITAARYRPIKISYTLIKTAKDKAKDNGDFWLAMS